MKENLKATSVTYIIRKNWSNIEKGYANYYDSS
jgi:hypothetical protein